MALRDVVADFKRNGGRKGVAVPKRSQAKPCAWKARKGDVWMPFDVLCDVADFSLHNAIVRVGGCLLHQRFGIPMGDPISPGMMYALDKNDRHLLRAKSQLRMVCVFNPPVTGQEVHDENGVYPAATTDS